MLKVDVNVQQAYNITIQPRQANDKKNKKIKNLKYNNYT